MNLTRQGLIALSLTLAHLPAYADQPGTQAQIEDLQQKVQTLETRLQALESRFDQGVPVNKALQVEAKPGGWRNQDNWSQLARDMTKEEVIRFLGEPDRRKSVKKFEYWYYGDGKASMYMNRLKAWEKPSTTAAR